MKYVIIGAGPAGLQMASFLDDYIVLEKGPSVCSFFRYFPRQRGFISINKARNLRFDWNSFLGDSKSFRDYSEELYPSADDYLRYAEDFTARKNLKVRFNYEVKSIEKLSDGTFSINGGEYMADKVFFGIGLVPREPTINLSLIHI
jgi:protoporphyrinogen oxidase